GLFRNNGKFFVETDGPDGKLATFEVKYTFGIEPLQQYLIEFPDGRLQALSLAWDTRLKDQGGPRWFHLYPDEEIKHDDILHWTKLNQLDSYEDAAVGHMEKNADGKLAITRVELRPKITWSGNRRPSTEELEKTHHAAHENCFIANSVKTNVTVAERYQPSQTAPARQQPLR